jgi:hypothetical protein
VEKNERGTRTMTRPDHVTPTRVKYAEAIKKIAPDLDQATVKDLALFTMREAHDDYFRGVRIGIKLGRAEIKKETP